MCATIWDKCWLIHLLMENAFKSKQWLTMSLLGLCVDRSFIHSSIHTKS